MPELPIAVFGDKTHVVINRTFGFIRSWAVTGAARHDAAVLREMVNCHHTAADVWADTVNCSKIDEAWLQDRSPGPQPLR